MYLYFSSTWRASLLHMFTPIFAPSSLVIQAVGHSLPEIGSMPSVRTFAECFLSGTRQTSYLSSVTHGIILHTATIQFAECQTLGEIKHSTYVQFAECPASDTRQNLTGVTPSNVCRVSRGDTRQT
jgi:hypothetical protein